LQVPAKKATNEFALPAKGESAKIGGDGFCVEVE